ncbi:MAG: HD domain-containing protein [Planctomycetaceae bacterium]|nr:HD domain-containing protein [Planctomycetaceae bacterium]
MDIIAPTADHVKALLSGEGSGHDWWHTERVWRMAKRIGEAEGADLLVVELAALLHDIADWKFHGGDSSVGPKLAREWLGPHVAPAVMQHVCEILASISFKGAAVEQPVLSLEGRAVQDADRLDAIGAIGIARAFAYGGSKGRPIYDPTSKPVEHRTAESYLRSNGTTINHFYEKLLLLKDRMNTATGRAIAEQRHEFMEEYLRQFYEDWEGGVRRAGRA